MFFTFPLITFQVTFSHIFTVLIYAFLGTTFEYFQQPSFFALSPIWKKLYAPKWFNKKEKRLFFYKHGLDLQ
jgi:hypothetical protein